MKNEIKIRKWLGDRYHLNVTIGGEELKTESWKLFRKYPGYLTDNSEAIMTSETHSEEDLYKFAKKHREYDSHKCIIKLLMLVAWIGLVLGLVNLFIDNNYFRMFYMGMETALFIIVLPSLIVSFHNSRVSELECLEIFEELKKECEKNEREADSRENN